jgi:branched-chain amino acid transport system substrate-binding protein
MVRRRLGIGILAASTFAISSCGTKKATEDVIKIGAVLSLSEDCSGGVDEIVEALALGAKEINAAGGVLGKKIEIVVRDDTSSPEVGKVVFDELIKKENPQAVIGAVCSGITAELIPIAQQRKVVLVSPSSTSPALTPLGASGYFFRTCAQDLEQGKLLAQKAKDPNLFTTKAPPRTAAVIHDRSAYGEGLRDAFKAEFEKNGGFVVPSYGMDAGASASRDQADTAVNAAFSASPLPDVVLLATFPNQADFVLQRYTSAFPGKALAWLFPDALSVEGFPAALRSNGSTGFDANRQNHLGTAPGTPRSEIFNAFRSRFLAEYSKEVTLSNYSPHAYDALFAIALAMQAAGSSNGEAVNGEMINISTGAGDPNAEKFGPERYTAAVAAINAGRPINFQGVTTPVDFSASGDTSGTFDIWHAIEGVRVSNEDEQDILPQ